MSLRSCQQPRTCSWGWSLSPGQPDQWGHWVLEETERHNISRRTKQNKRNEQNRANRTNESTQKERQQTGPMRVHRNSDSKRNSFKQHCLFFLCADFNALTSLFCSSENMCFWSEVFLLWAAKSTSLTAEVKQEKGSFHNHTFYFTSSSSAFFQIKNFPPPPEEKKML